MRVHSASFDGDHPDRTGSHGVGYGHRKGLGEGGKEEKRRLYFTSWRERE